MKCKYNVEFDFEAEFKIVGQLSTREFQVFELLADGRTSNRKIAEVLGVSSKTVESHFMHARLKLGMRSTSEMRAYSSRFKTIKCLLGLSCTVATARETKLVVAPFLGVLQQSLH